MLDCQTVRRQMSDVRLPLYRIVIPSAAEGSLSFEVRQAMFEKFKTGNLLSPKPSGIAPYILRRSRHHNPEP